MKAFFIQIMVISAVLNISGCRTASPLPNSKQAEPIPLFLGAWADPTILRVKNDYYMIHSTSGRYVPSTMLWHSKDLLVWNPVVYTHPDSNPSYAPDLTMVDDKYYLYCGKVDVLTADSPAGPWKNHGKLKGTKGIDPGHFVGFDGKRYLYTCMGLYYRLSDDGLRIKEGPSKKYHGWPMPKDIAIEGLMLESPKVFKKDNMYYMVSAQGGTFGPSTAHMAVVARSKNPDGPWEECPYNPIIRTNDRSERWWATGHATFFEGPGDNWFAIYHGYMKNYRLLGRCTLMLPLKWTKDGWPVAASKWPKGFKKEEVKINLPLSDEFDGDKLGLQWQSPRAHDLKRYELKDGKLIINGDIQNARRADIQRQMEWVDVLKNEGRKKAAERKLDDIEEFKTSDLDPIGYSYPLTVNTRHIAYEIETEVKLNGADNAGLILHYSPEAYFTLGLTKDGKVDREFRAGTRTRLLTRRYKISGNTVKLRIVNDRSDIRSYYQNEKGKWILIQASADISGMNDSLFSQCSSVRPGLYTIGNGKAEFSYFRYKAFEN